MRGTGIGENLDYVELTFCKGHKQHTIVLNEDHDSSAVEMLFRTLNNYKWRILSVKVFTSYGVESVNINSFTALIDFMDALITEPEHAGTILAYGELNGFNDHEFWQHTRHGRKFLQEFMGVYGSDLNRSIVEEFISNHDEEIPEWLSIDYDRTAETILNNFISTEIRGETYVFANA